MIAEKRQRLLGAEMDSQEPALVIGGLELGVEEVKEVHEEQKGLQVWTFDGRSRRRYYISRTGKSFSGADASKMYRLERSEVLGSTARSELQYLMNMVGSRLRDDENGGGTFDWKQLRSWGIPSSVAESYKSAGVEGLFDWQVDILHRSILNEQQEDTNSNLIYSAPTSGGKTLVSEVLMLRRLARRGGTIFFVVPFVALAEQKTTYFQEMWKDMHIGVRPFHAEQALTPLTYDIDVAVCTIEKANVLLNVLFEEGRQDQLSMVVIDEFHMIEDPHRGFLLEILIAKCLQFLPATQIVGMSATMPNLTDISQWLGGHFYSSQYRPVTLQVKLCSDRIIYTQSEEGLLSVRDAMAQQARQNQSEGSEAPAPDLAVLSRLFRRERTVPSNNNMGAAGGGGGDTVTLALESVHRGHSVIVFCGTKAGVEGTAATIVTAMDTLSTSNPPPDVRKSRFRLLDALRHTQGGLHPTLAKTVVGGVCFHHSGLMPEQRKILEAGFAEGSLKVVVATTTLAAGVNLPADRVIIKGMRTGINPLTVAAFRQMCGRAGRMGLGQAGEAVLVVGDVSSPARAQERRELVHLMTSEPEALLSRLHEGKGGGLEKLLLDVVACAGGASGGGSGGDSNHDAHGSFVMAPAATATTGASGESLMQRSLQCTLLHMQYPAEEAERYFKEARRFLLHHRFVLQVQTQEQGSSAPAPAPPEATFSVSPLGRATMASGVSPREAVLNLHFLERARDKLVLRGDVHALFLVTPPNHRIRIRWDRYIHIWDELCDQIPDLEEVAVVVIGVQPGKLQEYVNSPPTGAKLETPEVLLYKRFYATIVLLSVVSPSPTNVVEKYMELGPSDVYALQKETSMFCRGTTTFCRELNWNLLAATLESYADRLSFGVQEELLPLVRACGPEIMHGRRAKHFYTSGITSPADILSCSTQHLAHLILGEQPFSSREPLERSRQNKSSSTSASGGGGGGENGAGKPYSVEDAAASCAGLAALIQKKAKAYLLEEERMARQFASL